MSTKKQSNYFALVIRIGFEPMAYCLEGSCSIQLSYRTVFRGCKIKEKSALMQKKSRHKGGIYYKSSFS
jgi:hypothetical protein